MKKEKRIKANFTIPSEVLENFEKMILINSINKSSLIERLIEEWMKSNLYQLKVTCINSLQIGNINFSKENPYKYRNMRFTTPYNDIRIDIQDDNGNEVPFYIIGNKSDKNSNHATTGGHHFNDYFKAL